MPEVLPPMLRGENRFSLMKKGLQGKPTLGSPGHVASPRQTLAATRRPIWPANRMCARGPKTDLDEKRWVTSHYDCESVRTSCPGRRGTLMRMPERRRSGISQRAIHVFSSRWANCDASLIDVPGSGTPRCLSNGLGGVLVRPNPQVIADRHDRGGAASGRFDRIRVIAIG